MVLRERLSDIREVIHMTIREELEKMEFLDKNLK